MKLAFYKGRYGDWWDKLIRLWCYATSWGRKGKYSHVELVFSDGACFSSSPREGGTRFAILNFNPDHWDFVEIKSSKEDEKRVRDWCIGQSDRNYDYFAIFGYVFGYLIGWTVGCRNCLQDQDCWYCSEVCSCALKMHGIVPYKDARIDPDDMYAETVALLGK